MSALRTVHHVPVDTLSEKFIKLWMKYPKIKGENRFEKVTGLEGLHYKNLQVVKRGPKACAQYCKALRLGSAVKCNMLNCWKIKSDAHNQTSVSHACECIR